MNPLIKTGSKLIGKSGLPLLALCIVLIACKEEKLGDVEKVSGLGGDTWVAGPLDKWIADSLTTPHNIGVKYKWDQFELGDLAKILTPPDEDKIIPLLRTFKSTWITPYVQEAGLVFFNKYAPKFFILSGSYEYNVDGSYTLGQAEGGRKVRILGTNFFRIKGMDGYKPETDSTYVKEWVVRTMHHEFGHILHQNIMYPAEFKQISAGKYQGANWINYDDVQARRDGFITSYAMSGYDDDFVETLSLMLVEGRAGFNKMVNAIPEGTTDNGTTKAQAQAALRQKEAMIVSYMKKSWNIDFYSLQTRCRKSLDKLF